MALAFTLTRRTCHSQFAVLRWGTVRAVLLGAFAAKMSTLCAGELRLALGDKTFSLFAGSCRNGSHRLVSPGGLLPGGSGLRHQKR